MKTVIADAAWIPWAEEFAKRLGPEWTVRTGWDEALDADAIVATEIPPRLLPALRALRVFAYPGAGASHFCAGQFPAGCLLTNVFEHEVPVAEYVMMTMLMHATRLLRYVDSFRRGEWEGSGRVGGEPHSELAARTVGLFGHGHIGREVEARARAFGMNVVSVRRSGGNLDDMLPVCDYLVIAAPLTEETRGRIGERELALLPRHAYLINVARAEIVCESALYNALASGKLSGAALDVWYEYPRPGARGHGSNLPFHNLPNVISTPHFSGWTHPMIMRRIERMAENLNRFARGETLERIVLEGTWRP